jgi:cytidylate kinase
MAARVVAIDGPAGSGKSTVARGVANALALHTLDTGAMYRALTLAALHARVALDDADGLVALARGVVIEASDGRVTLAGRDVAGDVRGPEVTAAVSAVSAHPAVREVMVQRQRDWVTAHSGGVVEGRDIGTVVLPDAPVKVFLTARDDVRAERRRGDEAAAARHVDVGAVRESMAARDEADATLGRALRPEQAAEDAIVIDTTERAADDVIAEVVRRAEAAA